MRFDFSSFRRASAIALAGLLALGAAACDDWFTDPDPGLDLDGLLFSAREILPFEEDWGVGTPVTAISVRTVRRYGCAQLKGTLERAGSEITVTIDGVEDFTAMCNRMGTAPAYFMGRTPLDEGEYTLRIRRGQNTDTHRLVVSADRIEVTEGSHLVARAEFKRFWRYPGPSLAIFCSTSVWRAKACARLREKIVEKAGLVPVDFPSGDGIPFSELKPFGSDFEYTIHRYAGEEDLDAIQEALKESIRDHPSVQPVIIDWRNRWVHPQP